MDDLDSLLLFLPQTCDYCECFPPSLNLLFYRTEEVFMDCLINFKELTWES